MANPKKMARTGSSESSKKGPREVWAGHYATVSAMVKEELPDGALIAEDGAGYYLTTKVWLDKNMADPNRSSLKRFDSVEAAKIGNSKQN